MRAKQAISHTVYPDGEVVTYLFGLTPPSLTNLGLIMKEAALKASQEKLKSVNRKLKVA